MTTTQVGNSALVRTWANDGTVVTPSNAKIDEGWLRGEQPPHEWMNYIHNILGQKVNHVLSRGTADWVATTAYTAGATVNHSGGLWIALLSNTNSAPSGSNSNWAAIPDVSDIAQIISDAGGVTTDGTQTLTNKTIAFADNTLTGVAPTASPTFTGAIYADGSYRGNLTAVSVLDVDCSLGNYFTKSISANSTFTFGNAPASRAYAFTLRVIVSGDRTITWPAAVEWPGDEAPTLTADKVHLFMFVTDDGGTTWRGAFLADYEA